MSDEKESRPSPVDVHVGSRIRLRRTLLGMSQERLGDALGLTFQQVQKYERGANRVGASRLFDLSRILDVPIAFFYDNMPEQLGGVVGSTPQPMRAGGGFAESLPDFGVDERQPLREQQNTRETQDLVRAYYRIKDPAVRKGVFDLMKTMATPES